MTATSTARRALDTTLQTHPATRPGPATDTPSVVAPSAERALLTALRPRQWTKNVLVVSAPLAAGALLDPSKLLHVLAAFVMMCAAASSTYLINDLGDVERDRLHPSKRHRPIAAGWISGQVAVGTAVAAASLAVAIGAVLGVSTLAAVLAYLALTVSYSRRLKHVPFVELGVVATGFVLRVIAGAMSTATALSAPFLLIVGAGSLFLATGKRYSELKELGRGAVAHRPVLARYTAPTLERILMTSSATAVLGYIAWALSTRPGGAGMVWLLASVIPLLVAARRGVAKVFAGAGGDPTELILGDLALLASGGVTALLAIAGLYFS